MVLCAGIAISLHISIIKLFVPKRRGAKNIMGAWI